MDRRKKNPGKGWLIAQPMPGREREYRNARWSRTQQAGVPTPGEIYSVINDRLKDDDLKSRQGLAYGATHAWEGERVSLCPPD
jgi:hypothetical protein